MSPPHVEFVRHATGSLPEGAWVGTISKLDGKIAVISSKYFFGYQMPPTKWRKLFAECLNSRLRALDARNLRIGPISQTLALLLRNRAVVHGYPFRAIVFFCSLCASIAAARHLWPVKQSSGVGGP
jgi:hypothetical protein